MSDIKPSSLPRRIVLVAMPGMQLLDVAGPLDVFAEANAQVGGLAYETKVVSTGPGREIRSSSGARLMADGTLDDESHGGCDTLLVAGAPGVVHHAPSAATVAWLRGAAAKARRFGSVCTGAFILAETGLLDGHRVTTHWAAADAFARRHPAVLLERDAIHVQDGRLRTAAGVTAGLDLAVALVAEDLGREVAKRVAAQLVMFFKRPGGQMQFSLRGEAEPAGRAALQEIQRFVAAEPAADHRVAALAHRAGMSPRHFARLFQDEVGMTPAAWVEDARITAACRHLDTDDLPPKRVAALCGFANADTLRRAFVRHLGITPAAYRKTRSRE